MIFIKNEKLRKGKFDQKCICKLSDVYYLAMGSCPYIMFATNKASWKNKNPTYKDLENVLRIFRYLKGTKIL